MASDQATQKLVEIADIRREIVVLKNGSLRAIIEVSAINFELRSEEEQTAILQNFQRFLNSTDFPLQIVINSRRILVDDYIKYVQGFSEGLDELLKIQSIEYMRFIKELSTLSNIMSKKFYVVVPFYAAENPQKSGLKESLRSIMKPAETALNLSDEQLENYRGQIMQRVDLIFDGLISLGLKAKIMNHDELVNAFYNYYNPGFNLTKKIE